MRQEQLCRELLVLEESEALVEMEEFRELRLPVVPVVLLVRQVPVVFYI